MILTANRARMRWAASNCGGGGSDILVTPLIAIIGDPGCNAANDAAEGPEGVQTEGLNWGFFIFIGIR